MGAPAPVVAALVRSRTLRRIALGFFAVAILIAAFIGAPLMAIPLAVLGSGATSAVAQGAVIVGEWGYPLDGDYFKGRGFGWNPVRNCSFCSKNHKGYDMARGCGSPIRAAGPGRVTRAGSYGDLGNTVVIDHGDRLVTLYGHMQWNSLQVVVGDVVVAGTLLGSEGTTGGSTGCHLHFGIFQDGVPIDPQPFMAARGLPLT